MRLVTWLAAAMLTSTGCGGDHSPSGGQPDSQVPLEIPMQIVVMDGEVQVYMNAKDLGNCDCSTVDFPAAGSCTQLTDANPCDGNPYCHSCITDIGVEVDGQRLTVPPSGFRGNDPWDRYYGTFPSGSLSLEIAGCGHPSTRISLDGPAFLQTSATADYANGIAHVSWTTDQPSLSTLLLLSLGLGGELCQAQGVSEYTFTPYTYGLSVGVQSLGSRVDVDTDFGPATIWRAGSTLAKFPNPLAPCHPCTRSP